MAYVKKPRRKIKWKIAIPLLCLVLSVVYLLVNVLFPRTEDNEGVQICSYSISKTSALLEQEYERTYEISDYFFYGENLSFLQEPYVLGESDDLYGKTIQLRNLCNDEKILFQLTNSVDQQIDLGELEDGFYEVYIVNNLQEYRMTSSSEIDDVFHTITRNNQS